MNLITFKRRISIVLYAKRDDFDEEADLELCPICKTNYIQPDEIMCSSCLKEHRSEDGELAGDWEDYMVSDDDDDNMSMYDELGEMASVNDLTKAGMLDDDDMDSGMGFAEEDDIDFGDEEFGEESEELEDSDDFEDDFEDEEDFDFDEEDDLDDDFDDDDDEEDEDYDDDDE